MISIPNILSQSNTPPIVFIDIPSNVVVEQSIVLDGSSTYDQEQTFDELKFMWYKKEGELLVFIGEGSKLQIKFLRAEKLILRLVVEDSGGLSSYDEKQLTVESKKTCTKTNAIYVPQDTPCQEKWPTTEGYEVLLNTKLNSCELFEVCSDEIDSIIEETIDCCDGTPLEISNGIKKFTACNYANEFSLGNAKRCGAMYLIKGLGDNAVYMQDYFEAEMCCFGVESLCPDKKFLYKALPVPKSEKEIDELRCFYTNSLFGEITGKLKIKPVNGWWRSDTNSSENNIALSDVPTHVSLQILSTGTCVDYSSSLTTLLRKLGYKADEVMSAEANDHAYNLVKLHGDKKYTLVDTTGNYFGFIMGNEPSGYDYCKNIKNCYNDLGKILCPSKNKINGCESESIFSGTLFKIKQFVALDKILKLEKWKV